MVGVGARVRIAFEGEAIANRVEAEIVSGSSAIVVMDGRRCGGVAAHRNLIVLLGLDGRKVSESEGDGERWHMNIVRFFSVSLFCWRN